MNSNNDKENIYTKANVVSKFLKNIEVRLLIVLTFLYISYTVSKYYTTDVLHRVSIILFWPIVFGFMANFITINLSGKGFIEWWLRKLLGLEESDWKE